MLADRASRNEISPRSSALRAPTPLTASSASTDDGRSRAISRSVASWKITYGGTPRERAMSSRTARSRSNKSRRRRPPTIPPRRATARAARPLRGGRCRASARPGTAVGSLSSATPSMVSASTGTRRHPTAAARGRSAARCSRALRRPTASGSRPNVLSASWPRAGTCSLAWPRSTLATCVGAEPLADPRDARQNLARDDHRLGRRLELVEAVVAGAAARPCA